MSKLALFLSLPFALLIASACHRTDPKVEAEKTAAMANVTKFFNSIPQDQPENGTLKCYRKGTSSKIIVECRAPTRDDGSRISRDGLIKLLGTYFIVQEIRDLSQHQVTLTWIKQDMTGEERERITVAFGEIIPHLQGHDF